MTETYRDGFIENNCCVVVPTYNNAPFLEAVLKELQDYVADIIVVNDGSNDETASILESMSGIENIHFPKNLGKGAALKAGFQRALERGFDHALTLDSDSQHKPSDLPAFLEELQIGDNALVVGSRFTDHENMPGKNRFANRMSSFWFRISTGKKLMDTQSGFRLYPIRLLEKSRTLSQRYGYELEMLVKAAWKNIPLRTVAIDVHYPPGKERISHFKPGTDFLRIFILNCLLVFLGLAWYRPRLVFSKYRNKSLKQILKEDIIRSDTPRYIIALSVAFGVFMGILPIWGYQLVVGFFFAHLLRLNKAIFFITANISIPPMIPFILYLSYVSGSYVLGEGSWTVDIELNFASIGENLKQYLLGAVTFAAIASILSGLLSYALLFIFKRKQ